MQADQPICNGKYKLIRPIGEGGFGEVWLAAESASRDYHVAIKFAHKDKQEAEQRFAREIFLSRRLDHPHLLRADTVDREGDTPCLVFAYMAGGSLADKLQKGALPIADAVQIAISVADALAYLHEKDIVHRDVHPGNILFTKEGKVKLCDLGVAQSKDFSTSLWYGDKLDRHPGNIYYQPPEATGKVGESLVPLYPAADVFMLGTVLWEMLTGKAYYSRKGQTPKSLRSDVPSWLDDYVMQMLAPDVDRRPRDGEVAREKLRKALKGMQDEKPDKSRLRDERKGNGVDSQTRKYGLIALAVLALIVLGGFLITYSGGFVNITPTRVALAPTSTIQTVISTVVPATKSPTPSPAPTLTFTPTNTVTLIPTSTVTPSPTNTRVIFTQPPPPSTTPSKRIARVYEQKDSGNSSQIYVEYSDGSRVRLTDGFYYHTFPALSPDGSLLAFIRCNVPCSSIDLFMMKIDASDLKNITNDGQAAYYYGPKWSPDGKRLAFESSRNNPGTVYSNVYVVNANGSGMSRLTTTSSAKDFNPSWSPDGKRIAFETDRHARPNSANREIYAMNDDGSSPARLTFSEDSRDVIWLPDGRIKFKTLRGGNYVDMVMNADGSNQIPYQP